jgi:hypothetical protein
MSGPLDRVRLKDSEPLLAACGLRPVLLLGCGRLRLLHGMDPLNPTRRPLTHHPLTRRFSVSLPARATCVPAAHGRALSTHRFHCPFSVLSTSVPRLAAAADSPRRRAATPQHPATMKLGTRMALLLALLLGIATLGRANELLDSAVFDADDESLELDPDNGAPPLRVMSHASSPFPCRSF